jgi:DNA-binding transcriptional MerR regulator
MFLKIAKFAALAGLHPQTVRNYERKGLISPRRDRNNCRVFTDKDLEKVKEIILPASKSSQDQQSISEIYKGG